VRDLWRRWESWTWSSWQFAPLLRNVDLAFAPQSLPSSTQYTTKTFTPSQDLLIVPHSFMNSFTNASTESADVMHIQQPEASWVKKSRWGKNLQFSNREDYGLLKLEFCRLIFTKSKFQPQILHLWIKKIWRKKFPTIFWQPEIGEGELPLAPSPCHVATAGNLAMLSYYSGTDVLYITISCTGR